MTKNKATSKDRPEPADIDIEVVNPRYAGATPGMVAQALAKPLKLRAGTG